MVEQRLFVESVMVQIEANLPGNLQEYKRTTPQERSREMQLAAFGPDAPRVTEDEYQELIGRVRKFRTWLRKNGRAADDHPDFAGTDHPIFWVKDILTPEPIGISVELKPWEKHSVRNLEPYPKFSLDTNDNKGCVNFNLNFNDSYDLSIRRGDNIHFEISGLPRREMTQKEHSMVICFMRIAAERFRIE